MTKDTKLNTINLADLDTVAASNKPFKLELVHPTSKRPLGQYILIVGQESDRFREYNDEQRNEAILKSSVAARTGTDLPVKTIEQVRLEGTMMLVACTIDFDNINLNGPYPFSIENAKNLYEKYPWIREQVDKAVVNLANFMPG